MTGAAIGIGAGLAAAGTAVAGGALAVSGTKPRKQYFGGNQYDYAERKASHNTGVVQSNLSLGQGLGMIGQSAEMAQADRQQALAMSAQGQQIGDQGLNNWRGSIGRMVTTAGQQGPSVAALQMQQGLAQSQQAMQAQAATARGGNQAAAMRTAQATGAEMAMNVNAQAAQLRAAEEQARINRLTQAQQAAAQMYGQQTGLGYDMQSGSLGMAGQAAGMVQNAGQGYGQLALGSQGQFLGAQTAMDSAQLEADTQYAIAKAQAQQNKRNSLLALGGSLIGAGGGVMSAGMGK